MDSPVSRQPYQLGPVDKASPVSREKLPVPATDGLEGLDLSGVPPTPPPPVAAPAPRTGPRIDPAAARPKIDPRAMTYMPAPRRTPSARTTTIALAVVGVLVAVGAMGYPWLTRTPAAAAPATPVVTEGSATIISRPEGAQVTVDGVARGVTPLRLSLPIGSYMLELQNGVARRSLPLTIEAGSTVRQYVDLAPGGNTTGQIEVTSEPAGAQVSLNGELRGTTPLLIDAIEPGQYTVAMTHAGTSVNRVVQVSAGTTAMVMASLTPAGAAGGWVSFDAPFELQVVESGRFLGTSTTDRLMLPAGRHELELLSEAFGFRTTITANVPAGRTTTLDVPLPNGSLSINALPWADVWLDGKPLGTTPLGNLAVAIGNHEIVWRHPQHGERRQTVKVTADASIRAGVDLTQR
jgi:hypothetical protein